MSVLFERDTTIGRMGATVVKGAVATTGVFYACQFIADTTPTVFTIGNSTGNFADTIVYKAGTVVYGAITAITPDAAGVVILYKE